jgi:ubiquinone/menaquinone biosynthesis C-methylase UbiE
MHADISFDPQALKTVTRRQWDECAKGWDANGAMIRDWLRDATDAMLEMAGVRPGAHVLDVAAGAGDQTLDIAERIGPAGFVLATDLSARILELAAAKVRDAGYANVEFRIGDGENLDVAEASFDCAICRLGLMFFPDPGRGLREMIRALKPGGRACVMVFSSPDGNPCVGTVLSTALKHAGLPHRDPYQPGGLLSLGKPGLADELFRHAGFHDISTTKLAAPFRLPTVEHYLDFLRTSASPVVQILAALTSAEEAAAWADIRDRLSVFGTWGGWEGPNELLLTTGRR